jgi:hypothetical protein
VGDACDLADLWSVSPLHRGHIKDAVEDHWNMRLRGLRNALWLSLGSSIDHDWMKVLCEGFRAPHLVSDAAPPSDAYPWPGLLLHHCHVKQLNLTLAYTPSHGMVTTQTQTTERLQPTRFAEIDAALRRSVLAGSRVERADPVFLSFGGVEWDFKNWRCAFPQTQASWRRAIALLKMQAAHARRQWPSIRAVFSRTMFKPTYGTFGCACCASEADFWHYNHLLRQRELAWPPDGGACAGIHVLDLQRMLPCNDSVGTCSSRTGWTYDGLHVSRPVALQFLSLLANTAADLGERCRGFY